MPTPARRLCLVTGRPNTPRSRNSASGPRARGIRPRDAPGPYASFRRAHSHRAPRPARPGPDRLAARGVDEVHRHIAVDRVQDRAHHVAAKVLLGDDAVGLELAVGGDRDAGPALGRQIAGAVGQHIRGVVHAETDRDDADIVGALIFVAAGARRVDRYDDALQIT